ncbi:hypothetical protein [Pseudonocardia nigra]|uniref:hypothetical protein n=1 Tax=Pseudonocardia nigra TaxID=1921578 RepID=UPI001C5EB456|nr:hypothetical protein [Pseudonocardia nigra]
MTTSGSIAPTRSPHWTTGWLAGLGVVLVAAALLVTLIRLARTIAAEAAEIDSGLRRTAENTNPLWKVDALNRTLQRIVRAVRPPAVQPDNEVRQ